MSPEYLPEAALLLAGVFAAAYAIYLLTVRRWRRALLAGVAGLTCIAAAFVLGRSGFTHSNYSAWRRFAPSDNVGLVPADTSQALAGKITLVLGGTPVHVWRSNQFLLSVEGGRFLTLDSLDTGLLISCWVAGTSTGPWSREGLIAATVSQNKIIGPAPFVESERLSPHALVVRERSSEVLRVEYVNWNRIEIHGRFYLPGATEAQTVSFIHGMRWPGGVVSAGSGIDLTTQGKGNLNFLRTGLIDVVH